MKIKIILFFIIMSSLCFANFVDGPPKMSKDSNTRTKYTNLGELEEEVFGFKVDSKMTYQERLDILEKRLIGNVSKESVEIRIKKIWALLFLDGENYSLITKLSNLEKYIFKEKYLKKDIMTRAENIEEYLFKRTDNDKNVLEKINEAYSVLLIKESDFKSEKRLEVREFPILKIKTKKRYMNVSEGDVIVFNLKERIEGIAKYGTVYAKVVRKEKKGFRKEESVLLHINKLINEKGEEFIINKTILIKGNKRQLLGGSTVDINGMIIIG